MATANHTRPSDPATSAVVPTSLSPRTAEIPPLENGDRLTRAEFHRRYEAMPHVKKAELIEGVVYMGSPVRFGHHGKPTRLMSTWLGNYQAETPGVEGGDNTSILLDDDNEPQPDHILLLPRSVGGQSAPNAKDYVEGGPELVIEVAASTESYDLHEKLKVYRRNRVREYVVWRTRDQALDWFVWREGEFARLAPDAAGVFKSETFPGLWLDSAALLRGDLPALLASLRLGLASPEHQAFVTRLRERAT